MKDVVDGVVVCNLHYFVGVETREDELQVGRIEGTDGSMRGKLRR